MREILATALSCPICSASVVRSRDLRWIKDGHDITRCRTCGTLFRADLPTREELDEIYSDAYFFSAAGDTRGQGYLDYLREEANHRATARRRLQLLEPYRSSGRLLDVGCAAGFFADEASRHGWNAEGVELSATMADLATTLGFSVHHGPFSCAELPAASFDVVTMWDYIEHSTDPVGDLRRASEVLRPGGAVALTTGDAASLVARLSGSRWHLLTPRHHNFFFTPATIEVALERAGLRVRSVAHPGARYTLAYLTHKLRTLADVPGMSAASARMASSRLGGISIPLNVFDGMTVLATKGG